MDFIKAHQLNIMLIMSGVCGILAIMTHITKSLPRKTKFILVSMEVSAMMLLIFDRYSYIYRGDTSTLGFYMVRIGNGMVYFFLLFIPFLVTGYLADVLANEGKLQKKPVQLVISDILFAAGVALLAVSQFTGLYYTFDSQNRYRRSPFNVICYIIPFLIVLLQEWSIIKYRKRIKRSLANSMIVSIALPTVASVLQIFIYGISLTTMMTAFVVIVFYTYALNFLSEAAERARMHEIESYRKAQKKEAELFEQTVEALAKAIDAKDKYTRGHSTRVAYYSRQIAIKAGLPDKACEQVYFSALLHDIGKIGVSSAIINKEGKLTDKEFEHIKEHPIAGDRILSGIKNAPFLSVGARSHHERYDGHGYPDGLAGEDIPQIARIISVADAYDAMTSDRSYRQPLEKDAVREELKNCAGTQFDPEFAEVMLQIMDETTDNEF